MTDDDPRGADEAGRRIGLALSWIEPSPAPVTAVLRKGKTMRLRRRIGVAAGVAVVAVAAIVVPGLVRTPPGGPLSAGPQPRPPKVIVFQLPSQAKDGVIAAGVINGRRWRVVLDNKDQRDGCGTMLNGSLAGDCVFYAGGIKGTAPSPAGGLGGGTNSESNVAMWGQVSDDVTGVSLILTDGVTLHLRPVSAFGIRAVGVQFPASLSPIEAVAYGPRGEIGYAIPFLGRKGESPQFVSWLKPGQRGPARLTRTIGSSSIRGQRVTAVGFAGPWGLCVNLYSAPGRNGFCWPVSALAQGGPGLVARSPVTSVLPRWFLALSGPGVAWIRLLMSDGSSVRVPVVRLAGLGFYLVTVSDQPKIARWDAFDAAGRRLSGGIGSPSGGN